MSFFTALLVSSPSLLVSGVRFSDSQAVLFYETNSVWPYGNVAEALEVPLKEEGGAGVLKRLRDEDKQEIDVMFAHYEARMMARREKGEQDPVAAFISPPIKTSLEYGSDEESEEERCEGGTGSGSSGDLYANLSSGDGDETPDQTFVCPGLGLNEEEEEEEWLEEVFDEYYRQLGENWVYIPDSAATSICDIRRMQARVKQVVQEKLRNDQEEFRVESPPASLRERTRMLGKGLQKVLKESQ